MKNVINFIKELFNHFFDSDTFQKGASLAYYAVFSLIPIIVIIVSVLGLLYGDQAVEGEVYNQLNGILGDEAANQIEELIKNQHINHNSILTTILGIVTLALSASGMFTQVHSLFNNIWNLKSKPKSSILNYITTHLVSFILLIGLFFIITISTSVNSFLITHAENIHPSIEMTHFYEHIASIALLSIIFSLMFKFLGDAIIHWKAAILGGIFTAILFSFGKIGIGLYIGHSNISSTFGSASTIALVMLWVYYTSQIIFLGASFVKIISEQFGFEILPNKNAIKIEHIEVES